MISVIICTRNRSRRLKGALDSIRQLTCGPGWKWEVVIVDNNSSDDTKSVVESFAATPGLNVQYVFEGRKGLSYARNTGMQKARGEIIAFTDDDVILDQDWLAQIARESSEHASVSMYFGQTHLLREDVPRIAIREGDSPVTYQFPCNPSDPGCGNNMILRKAVLASIGAFDTVLGAGTPLGSGEDTDFTYRVLRSGGTVRYCPSILAFHDHDRISLRAVRKLLFVYGKGRGAFYCKHMLKRDPWAAKMLYWEVRDFLRGMIRPGRRISSVLHLTGLVVGFVMRLDMGTEMLNERQPEASWG
jgi:glycosyltransferase involved in cell wall biosynthesis